jgi:hypothetical protein
MARSRLHRRIASQPGNQAAHMGTYHPVADMEHVMPLSVVEVSGSGMQVSEAVPLVTDRGVVPATGRGSWAQVHAAGRP